MRIAYASDLHLEFPNSDRRSALTFPSDVDVIVLAGDIRTGRSAAEEALALANQFPSAQIVWVAGNHEFYYRNINNQIEEYRALCDGNSRVHFLENDSIKIGKVRFIGCTLWTDFSILGEQRPSMEVAERSITDFRLIQTRPGHRFKPLDAVQRFEESRKYIEQELSISQPEATVVVTHFPPGLATRHQGYELGPISAYFQANVDDIIDRYEPALWIYGHNHYSNDMARGATRLVSNQLGYPSEAGHIPSYSADNVITLSGSSEANDDRI